MLRLGCGVQFGFRSKPESLRKPLNPAAQPQKKKQNLYTCRPMTHCPAFIFSSSNILSCLSAYFTPMSTRDWQPLVLAWKRNSTEGCNDGYTKIQSLHKITIYISWYGIFTLRISVRFSGLTMLASASSVVWTWVMLPFSNRSLASKMSWGFRPYIVMALMKCVRFSS